MCVWTMATGWLYSALVFNKGTTLKYQSCIISDTLEGFCYNVQSYGVHSTKRNVFLPPCSFHHESDFIAMYFSARIKVIRSLHKLTQKAYIMAVRKSKQREIVR